VPRPLIFLALAAGATLLRPAPAVAAESYDNCTGFIASLPATITTQGTWCLDRDLSTAISSGSAITVAVNNVTIDCNHFKIGGLQAGPGTNAIGIRSDSRLNATVRNCNIRGFRTGVSLEAGGGHLVEGNRLDGNTRSGIVVSGGGSIIRDNQVVDTGAASFPSNAEGILAGYGVDVIGNTVSGVEAAGTDVPAYGIQTVFNSEGSVIGNRVRGILPTGSATAYGIYNIVSGRMIVRDNAVQGPGSGVGIRCASNQSTAMLNAVSGFSVGVENCLSESNAVNPN